MNLLHMLQMDHRRFLIFLDRLDETLLDSENRYYTRDFSGEAGKKAIEMLQELLPEMRRHEEIEQNLLFPELRRRAPKGEQCLEQMAQEHGCLEGLLRGFAEELSKCSAKPMSRVLLDLVHLTNTLRSHILCEETGLYNLAEKSIPVQELERLGRQAWALRTDFPSAKAASSAEKRA